MMTRILALSLALACAPSVALAQSASSTATAPEMNARMQLMKQFRELHDQARVTMLRALSPQSRNLLAEVAGNLVIEERPDYRDAVARLDAGLSQNEKNAIFGAESTLLQSMRALHAQMVAAMGGEGAMPHERAPMPPGGHPPSGQAPVRSAGRILLMMTHDIPMEPVAVHPR